MSMKNLNEKYMFLNELYEKSPFFKDMVDNYDNIAGNIKDMVFASIMDDVKRSYENDL